MRSSQWADFISARAAQSRWAKLTKILDAHPRNTSTHARPVAAVSAFRAGDRLDARPAGRRCGADRQPARGAHADAAHPSRPWRLHADGPAPRRPSGRLHRHAPRRRPGAGDSRLRESGYRRGLGPDDDGIHARRDPPDEALDACRDPAAGRPGTRRRRLRAGVTALQRLRGRPGPQRARSGTPSPPPSARQGRRPTPTTSPMSPGGCPMAACCSGAAPPPRSGTLPAESSSLPDSVPAVTSWCPGRRCSMAACW